MSVDAEQNIIDRMAECPDFLDFPTAWAIQKGVPLDHHPKCSAVPGWHPLSGPALLCDCGAVKAEWKRRALAQKE